MIASMGQNHDAPNPSATSIAKAVAQAEAAMGNLQAVRALMDAIAGCTLMIDPAALYPVRDAVDAIDTGLSQAWKVLRQVARDAKVAQ